MKLQLRLLFLAVLCTSFTLACSSSSGSRSESETAPTASDGLDGSDRLDGATDAVDQVGQITDGTDSLDGATADETSSGDDEGSTSIDNTVQPEPVCDEGAFECKDAATLMVCEEGQWRLKHNCPAPYECDAEAGTCTKQSCTPEGTGKNVGDIVKDVSFDLVDGSTYNLHDACVAGESTMIIKVDTWCYWCGEYAPLWQFMADDHVKNGARFLLLVGRDGQQAPATKQIAQAYKANNGYNDNWMVAADPAHLKIDGVLAALAPGVPSMAVIGPDMRIAYIDPPDGGTLKAPFTSLSEASGYYPAETCEGFCGAGISPAWCYCTQDCVEYDNCCPDACSACGVACN